MITNDISTLPPLNTKCMYSCLDCCNNSICSYAKLEILCVRDVIDVKLALNIMAALVGHVSVEQLVRVTDRYRERVVCLFKHGRTLRAEVLVLRQPVRHAHR